jgi:hypothetical protein
VDDLGVAIAAAVEAGVSAKYAKKVLKRLQRQLEAALNPTPAPTKSGEDEVTAGLQHAQPAEAPGGVEPGPVPPAPKARGQRAQQQQPQQPPPPPLPARTLQQPPPPPTSPKPQAVHAPHHKHHAGMAQPAGAHRRATKAHGPSQGLQTAPNCPAWSGAAAQRAATAAVALKGPAGQPALHPPQAAAPCPRGRGVNGPAAHATHGQEPKRERRHSVDRQAHLQQQQQMSKLQPPPPPPPPPVVQPPQSLSQQAHSSALNRSSLYSESPASKLIPLQRHQPPPAAAAATSQFLQPHLQMPVRQPAPLAGIWGSAPGTPMGWQEGHPMAGQLGGLFGSALGVQQLGHGVQADPPAAARNAAAGGLVHPQQPPAPIRAADFQRQGSVQLDRMSSMGRQSLDASLPGSLASSLGGDLAASMSRSETPHAGLLGAGSSLFAHSVVPSSPLAGEGGSGLPHAAIAPAAGLQPGGGLAFGPSLLEPGYRAAGVYSAFPGGLPPLDAAAMDRATHQQQQQHLPPLQEQPGRRNDLSHHAPLQLTQSHFGPTVSANGGQGTNCSSPEPQGCPPFQRGWPFMSVQQHRS